MSFPIKKTTIDWQDYLKIFLRRRRVFTIPTVSLFVIITIISLTLPRVYRANTVIHVEEEKIINPLIKDLAVSASVSSRLNTLREEILSWPRLVELVTKLDMAKKVRTKIGFEDLLFDIRKRITVAMYGEDLIKIGFEDEDPVLAQKVVQTISDVFIEANLLSQTEESQVAIDFIRKQLEVYEGKLEDAEKMQALFELRAQLETLERDRLILVQQLSGQRKVIVSEVTTQVNPVVTRLRDRLAGLEFQLADVLIDSTDAHPHVIMLRRQIKETQNRIKTETENIVASEKSTSNPIYQSLEEKLKSIEIEIGALKSKESALMPAALITVDGDISQHDLSTASRNTRVNESIYAMLLNKLETANITERLEVSKQGTRFHILEPARLPIVPIKPNRAQIFFLGLLFSLAFGAGCVILAEMFDRSMRNQEEADAALDLMFLGAIPLILTEEDKAEKRRKKEEWQDRFRGFASSLKGRILPSLSFTNRGDNV